MQNNDVIEVVEAGAGVIPSEIVTTRAARKLLNKWRKAEEVIVKHESAASQARLELTNEVNNFASDLSGELDNDDCTVLLRLLARLGMRG